MIYLRLWQKSTSYAITHPDVIANQIGMIKRTRHWSLGMNDERHSILYFEYN